MTNGNWKAVERGIAKMIGGTRVPVSGRNDGSADIDHKWLAVEVKNRKAYPSWIVKALSQAQKASVMHKNPNNLPIVVLHEKNTSYGESCVMLKLSDFCDWFVNVQQE